MHGTQIVLSASGPTSRSPWLRSGVSSAASSSLLAYLVLVLWTTMLLGPTRAIGLAPPSAWPPTLFWHVFINIGTASGLSRLFGVTLPMVSYVARTS